VPADLALTRVTPEGSMIVTSSQGGGVKDTWIVAAGAVPAEGARAVRAGVPHRVSCTAPEPDAVPCTNCGAEEPGGAARRGAGRRGAAA